MKNLELKVEILTDNPICDYQKIKLGKEILKQWVEALESGEFQQGIGGFLCSNDKYCCLGLLAKIEGTLVKNGSFGYFNKDKSYLVDHGLISDRGRLPFIISFKNSDGNIVRVDSLALMNDRGANFKQIAWVIKTLLLN